MAGASASGSGRKAGSDKSLTVDLEAFFRELQTAPKDESGARTFNEMAEELKDKYSRYALDRLVTAACNCGALECVKVPRPARDMAVRKSPAYRIKK